MDEAIDTVPLPLRREPTQVPEQDQGEGLGLEFTGSGSEYFRIWIVNLLLTIVTLGMYFPWAKVRKLRYFYGNTLIGGEPLGFHGDPKKMFKGYALVAVFFSCYSTARKFSPTAGLVALLLAAVLWPALMKSAQQFRLANTSWRGLRFRFTGSLGDAYRALLPLLIPGALVIGLAAMRHDTAVVAGTRQILAQLSPTLLVLLLGPLLLWRLKKYQHDNYALGTQQTRFSASLGSAYKLAAKVFVGYVACIAGVIVLVVVWATNIWKFLNTNKSGNEASLVLPLLVILLIALLLVAVYAYAVARLQDLTWNHTASSDVAFNSTLSFSALFQLNLKNWFCMLFTLGLYWPFAAIAIQRLRVEAVSLDISIAPEQLVADGLEQAGDATGLAAGDFFGFDIGL